MSASNGRGSCKISSAGTIVTDFFGLDRGLGFRLLGLRLESRVQGGLERDKKVRIIRFVWVVY